MSSLTHCLMRSFIFHGPYYNKVNLIHVRILNTITNLLFKVNYHRYWLAISEVIFYFSYFSDIRRQYVLWER